MHNEIFSLLEMLAKLGPDLMYFLCIKTYAKTKGPGLENPFKLQ